MTPLTAKNFVEPPSLDEVNAIVKRRTRTRLRVGQSLGAVVLTAGITYGLVAVDRSPAELPTAAEPPVAESAAPAAMLPGCGTNGHSTAIIETLAASQLAFAGLSDQEQRAAVMIGVEWQVPEIEAQLFVGAARLSDFEPSEATLDEAFNFWFATGRSAEELGSISKEWNVSSVTIKALSFINNPTLSDVIDGCL